MNDRPSPSPADSAPWYRHPWPWLLISGPAIVVVAGIATAVIAHRSDDGMVADDYYKRGLLVNKQIAAMPPAAPPISVSASLGADGTLRVVARGPDDEDEALVANLLHPATGTREQVTLVRGADGHFAAKMASLQPGRWVVTFAPRHGQWPTTLVERGAGGGAAR